MLRCKTHPNYKAIKEPKRGCQQCWYLWIIATLSYSKELIKKI